MTVRIAGSGLSLEAVERVARGAEKVEFDPKARKAVDRSRALVEEILASRKIVYGINTGVGDLKTSRSRRPSYGSCK